MESEQQHVQANITNEVGERLLQLSAHQFQSLNRNKQRRVLECILGQACLFGLSNFRGELLVNVIYQI